MNKNKTDEIVFEIQESALSGTFNVLIDGKILAEMVDEDVAKLLLDAAKGFHTKKTQLAAAQERIADLETALDRANTMLVTIADEPDSDGHVYAPDSVIRVVIRFNNILLAKSGSQ